MPAFSLHTRSVRWLALVGSLLTWGTGVADCAASLGGGGRWYPDRSDTPSSYRGTGSVAANFECTFTHDRHSLAVDAFGRAARHDDARTHMDIRELVWTYSRDSLQLRAGVDQVFWGVTEFAHVADVINQADILEDPFGETKLGQPLASIGWRSPWGSVTALGMPRFRERIFPDPGDPLRPAPPLGLGAARFESADGREHFDWALRYSLAAGALDLGASYFEGTGRDPLFVTTPAAAGVELYPFYPQIAQAALDLQLTLGEWAWKGEAARRRTLGREQWGWTMGIERLLAGVAGTAADLTVVLEYSRDRRTPTPVPGFLEDDWAFGLRLSLNDVRTTEGKFGVIVDRRHGSRAWALELSSRLRAQWRVAAEVRWFGGVPDGDPLRAMRDDGYLDVAVTRYF